MPPILLYKHLVDLLNQVIFSEVLTDGHVLKLRALSNCSKEKSHLKQLDLFQLEGEFSSGRSDN